MEALGLEKWLINQCGTLGITQPSEVQQNCIPPILQGRDCIGCAKTGSGKTFAFALPVVQKLAEDPYGIYCLVLTPTRELAFQIGDQFKVIGKPLNLRVSVIVGGMDSIVQGKDLAQKPHIVVATPGRLQDLLESNQDISFSRIKFLILDEADRLLEGHFDEQLQSIFAVLPRQRQTLLFSATLTDTLRKMKDMGLNNPFFWEQTQSSNVETLVQSYVLTPVNMKDAYLVHLVREFRAANPKGAIMVFTDTCKSCQVLGMTFAELGYSSIPIHSMMSQKARLSALAKFKSNQIRILIATDVASRGLDIPTCQLVVNHNVPTVPKEYVHRVGRTARAGRGGTALTLMTPHEVKLIHAIEARIGKQLAEHKVKEKDVAKIVTEVMVVKREQLIKLDETDFDEKREINKRKKKILLGEDVDEDAASSSKPKAKKNKRV